MDEEDIRDFMDLATWSEQTGVSNKEGPQCPHCSASLAPRLIRRDRTGPYACPRCTGLYRCVVMTLADLTVYTTWSVKYAWSVVAKETTGAELVLRDNCERLGGPSITSAVEEVLAELRFFGLIWEGRRLFYYDSMNIRDEIVHRAGKFLLFRAGPDRERGKQ